MPKNFGAREKLKASRNEYNRRFYVGSKFSCNMRNIPTFQTIVRSFSVSVFSPGVAPTL